VGFGYLTGLFYEHIFEYCIAMDFIIVGEPESTFLELCKFIIEGSPAIEAVRGLVRKHRGNLIFNGHRDNEPDLDVFPFPDRSLLKHNLYGDPFLDKPMTTVVTPHIQFTCLSRADTLDEETLRFMVKAGCKMIFLGIESGSQKILDYYDKGYRIDEIRKKCKLIKASGIDITCWFIIGALQARREDLRKSIQFALDVNADFICVNELKLLPGTVLYEKLKNNIKFSLIPFDVKNIMTTRHKRKLFRQRQEFYLSFYCTPKIMFKMLSRVVYNLNSCIFFMKEFISVMRNRYIKK